MLTQCSSRRFALLLSVPCQCRQRRKCTSEESSSASSSCRSVSCYDVERLRLGKRMHLLLGNRRCHSTAAVYSICTPDAAYCYQNTACQHRYVRLLQQELAIGFRRSSTLPHVTPLEKGAPQEATHQTDLLLLFSLEYPQRS